MKPHSAKAAKAKMAAAHAASPAAIHRSFLTFGGGRYAKAALLVTLASLLLYWLSPSDEPPNGATWVGYTLGTAGFALIGWLAWFGIRRRRYGGAGRLENLLSAHVYLGLALVAVATLHTGFAFHWNVHTLAYVLMVAVIASGIFGAYAFLRYPPLMTANRSGATLGKMAGELASLDARCREQALAFPDQVAAAVDRALVRPKNGAAPASTATLAAIRSVETELTDLQGATAAEVVALVQALTQRAALLDTLHRDRWFRGLMLLWRAVHVPLTVALIAALTIHVFAVFYYW
jgi:hypothetical protein